MNWLMAWVTNTAWVAFFPVVFFASLAGLSNGMAADMMSNMPLSDVHGPGSVLPKLLFGSIALLMLYILTPVIFLGAYVLAAVSLTDLPGWDAGARGINILLAALIGGWLGFYSADKILNRIDAYFGLDNRLAGAINSWLMAGGAYMAIKAAKAGREIIRRI